MLRVSPHVVDGFEQAAVDAWAVDTAQFMARTYRDYLVAMNIRAVDLLPLVHAVQQWAARYECTVDRDVRQLCCVAMSLGHQFWEDPRFAHYVNVSLRDRGLPRTHAVKTLVGHATEWLTQLWKDDGLAEFGERLSALVVGGYPLNSQTLEYVLPGHAAMFTPDDEARLLDWLRPRLPETGYAHQRMSYICLALPLGMSWWADPQYRHVAHHVASHTDPQALVNGILPMFRALP
ncbi:hypothetical protein [Tateyamaria sp. ANG-S1]|uniref:hypothetical protein n=1 Tax=Tateyamaria sp. ANG-S1 TaxID=1577905 RepID=UPI00057F48DC|nr:hypothetical protein [Tateyamaria sp. ANG-S1]KIC47751.1 hypothetical protein RA29_19250 [Tateyamaria sp. ANG-S1]